MCGRIHVKNIAQIHTKASPAMLRPDEYNQWLDCETSDDADLSSILTPRIVQGMRAQQIDLPSLRQTIGQSFMISAD